MKFNSQFQRDEVSTVITVDQKEDVRSYAPDEITLEFRDILLEIRNFMVVFCALALFIVIVCGWRMVASKYTGTQMYTKVLEDVENEHEIEMNDICDEQDI